jgi:hypothetical protein
MLDKNSLKHKYKAAIAWIAHNDEDSNLNDLDSLRQQLTVLLVADVFDVAEEVVAQEVMRARLTSL